MVGAGISLPKALKTMATQTENKKFHRALTEIGEAIIGGESFSEALKRYPDIFSEIFSSMAKVGEESGTLEENLGILASQMEKERELKSKIQSALIYPIVIIGAMIGIGIMMLVVVVPKLAQTFKDLEVELPLTTKIVIGFSSILAEKWYFVVVVLIILVFSVKTALKTKSGKKIVSSLFLNTPIVSPIIKKTNSSQAIRTLASLIAAGIPLLRSLEIVSETQNNFYYQKAIKEAVEIVRKGGKLSEALKPYRDLFSLTVIQMIEVGEETGETSKVLEKLSDFFEEEVAAATKNLVAVIEPVIMLAIGAVVGFFAISMVQPLYSMLSGLEE